MKIYFKNLIRDIKSTWFSFKHIKTNTFYDIGTLYLQWEVLRMLSKEYGYGDIDKPLNELSQKRYDKLTKRVMDKIANDDFYEIDY